MLTTKLTTTKVHYKETNSPTTRNSFIKCSIDLHEGLLQETHSLYYNKTNSLSALCGINTANSEGNSLLSFSCCDSERNLMGTQTDLVHGSYSTGPSIVIRQ